MIYVNTVITSDYMGLLDKIKNIFKKKESYEKINNNVSEINIKEESFAVVEKDKYNYTNLWDYIKPKENTQAEHILTVVIIEDWLDMDQIRKKIKDIFFIEYKHEKSLYPYIKTLVDIGLLETSSVGGKRKWKKKDFIINNKFKEEYIKITN